MNHRPNRQTGIDYDRIFREQMVGIVRRVLSEVAENGLPGDHHFYLEFVTKHSRVSMPDWLAAKYPETMMIVLQHEFWHLEVDDSGFSVTLGFNGKRERLTVPFDALVGFADPHVKFSLGLMPIDTLTAPVGDDVRAEKVEVTEEKPVAEARPDLGDNVVSLPFGRK